MIIILMSPEDVKFGIKRQFIEESSVHETGIYDIPGITRAAASYFDSGLQKHTRKNVFDTRLKQIMEKAGSAIFEAGSMAMWEDQDDADMTEVASIRSLFF